MKLENKGEWRPRETAYLSLYPPIQLSLGFNLGIYVPTCVPIAQTV